MKHSRLFLKRAILVLMAMILISAAALVFVGADEPASEPSPKYEANPKWYPDAAGVYHIKTPEDFYAMALADKVSYNNNYKDKTIVLDADIDLNPGWKASDKTAPTNVWNPIQTFSGTFDGQGHTISGIYSNGKFTVNKDTGAVTSHTHANASIFVNLQGATIKDLRVENSYFTATNTNAGLFSCVRHDSRIENVYSSAIVESTGDFAGGIVSRLSIWSAADGVDAKATFVNCVFTGTVSGRGFVGGILGTNKGNVAEYDVTMIDCANYGTVTSTTGVAGGVIGSIYGAGKANLTRCYNSGSVNAEKDAHIAIANISQTTAVPVTFADCYYAAETGVEALTKTAEATDVTITYDGVAATGFQTATPTELVTKTAFQPNGEFKGWIYESNKNLALPKPLLAFVCSHDYEGVVTAPSCSEQGYTTYTCKICGHSYVGDYTDTIPHTEADEWIVDKEPTESKAGSRHKVCTVCGATVKTEILPKLPATTTAESDTEVPTTEAPTAEAPAKKSGCKGSLTLGGTLGILLICSCGVALGKKKEKNI